MELSTMVLISQKRAAGIGAKDRQKNCFCGENGCSRAEVEVAHQSDEILWKKMWHTDWDGISDEDKKREFNFTEKKIGHPDIKKELPLKFDKQEYRTLILNLTSHNKMR